MHPQLAAALDRLDAVTRDLETFAGGVPADVRARKPASDRWSINEVLEHVSLVEQLFVTALVGKIGNATASGLAAEVEQPAMLTREMQTVVEDRSNRRMAPEQVHPAAGADAMASLQKIKAGHANLREALLSADGLALSSVTHEHRFFGVLNVYQWVDLIASHERRHLEQVRETAAQLTPA